MTFVGPVGTIPAGPIAFDRTIRRSGAFACAGVLAALNAQADQIINALRYQSITEALSSLGGISAVIWLAMYAALRIGFEQESDAEKLRRKDVPVLCAIVILSFVPLSFAAKTGLLLSALYALATSRRGTASRRVALILLALTGPLIWGRMVLQIFGQPILSLDAHLVGLVTGTAVDGNTVRVVGENFRMLIGGPCSSVNNISLAIVLWTTAAVVFRVKADGPYLAIGAAMAAWMFVLNVARLTSIGLFPAYYHFLHYGPGAAVFGWIGLIGAGLLAGVGVLHAAARQR